MSEGLGLKGARVLGWLSGLRRWACTFEFRV